MSASSLVLDNSREQNSFDSFWSLPLITIRLISEQLKTVKLYF